MKLRVITALVGLVVLGAVLLLYNTFVFNIILVVVCVLALHEAYNAFKFKNANQLFFALCVYAALAILTISKNSFLLLPLTFLLAIFTVLYLVIHSTQINVAQVSLFLMFSLFIVTLCYSIAFIRIALPVTQFGNSGLYFILISLGSAWGGDSAAYFAGRFLGKRKLAPNVSPNKTVEGAIGGVLGSVFVGCAVTLVWFLITGTSPLTRASNVSITQFAVVVVICAISSLLGILGDLLASVIKRHCNIKDYGAIFPGHGGIMDRFDSVMLIMPFMAVFIKIIDITII